MPPKGGRADRRFTELNPGKTDMGRDELFLQRMKLVPKGRRINLDQQGEE